jgi:hypothetical protein
LVLEAAEGFAEFGGGGEAVLRWPEELLSEAWLERNYVGG